MVLWDMSVDGASEVMYGMEQTYNISVPSQTDHISNMFDEGDRLFYFPGFRRMGMQYTFYPFVEKQQRERSYVVEAEVKKRILHSFVCFGNPRKIEGLQEPIP